MRMGICRSFQIPQLFPELSVLDNMLIAVSASDSAWPSFLQPLKSPARIAAAERLASTYRRIPEVQQLTDRKASLLSGGQQKLVALARSLMIGRRLLLLDEPFEGVAPALAQRLIEVIAGLKGRNATVLISESDYVHSRDLVDQVFEALSASNEASACTVEQQHRWPVDKIAFFRGSRDAAHRAKGLPLALATHHMSRKRVSTLVAHARV
jgi:ABC-type branched-subunit amino acid transport system ATPase component